MFYAKNQKGEYIFADQSAQKFLCYCPECRRLLSLRRSRRGRYFFVHKSRCTGVGGEGDAHIFWKKYIANQLKRYNVREEVKLSNNRRADIFVDKTVIEIQLSLISEAEIKRRIYDYAQLGLQQYWLFRLPSSAKQIIALSPMLLYIWKFTKIPLLCIHFETKQLLHIEQLQFIRKNRALYMCKTLDWKDILKVKRVCIIRKDLQILWSRERQKQLLQFTKQAKLYTTEVIKQLYYISSLGYSIEDFGRPHNANQLFTVSPFVWQIQLIYCFFVLHESTEVCCSKMKLMMQSVEDAVVRGIVDQVLEQFLVSLENKKRYLY